MAYELFFYFFSSKRKKRNKDINKDTKREKKELWKFVNGKDGKWTDKTMQNEAMVLLKCS